MKKRKETYQSNGTTTDVKELFCLSVSRNKYQQVRREPYCDNEHTRCRCWRHRVLYCHYSVMRTEYVGSKFVKKMEQFIQGK